MLTRRNSLRLKGFDYSLPEAYFITICCFQRQNLLGTIEAGSMILNPLGLLVEQFWKLQSDYFPALILDAFVTMPNHFHALLGLNNSLEISQGKPVAVPRVVQALKSITTIEGKKPGYLLENRLWQPGYYDHIVRTPASLERIREYIASNPMQWELDRENLERTGTAGFYDWLQSEGRRAPPGAR